VNLWYIEDTLMKIINTGIPNVMIIEPGIHGDARGWFSETWSVKAMQKNGLFFDFIQDNHAFSSEKGTLRGIHLQNGDAAQAKLIRCTKGAVLDVAVDLRKGSPAYKKWVAVELPETNKRQLLIPRGFGHGYLTLTENAEVLYKVDNDYMPATEISILWNDPDIGIEWGISAPILSAKDSQATLLKDAKINYTYKG
jgi:dTDP-4-dehydrorhamnose 3,5-epimerase